ncbi:MAG: WG repeat-containing protein [Clostridiales bacterium]|nr:WG repeat-containing protein [Clostridiales bacterium]
MKRYLLCFFICVLLLFACACEEQESVLSENDPDINEAPIEFSEPTFYLETIPRFEPFEAPREIVSRYYDEEFVDTLRPASDYGRLYPYAGKFIGDSRSVSDIRYGLVDVQGRVVVDPVYGRADYLSREEGEDLAYLLLVYPVDEDDGMAQKLAADSEGYPQQQCFVFASTDGSWVSDAFCGSEAQISEGRIIIHDYGVPDNNYQGIFRIYDLEAHLVAQGEGMLYGFQEGLSVVQHQTYNKQDDSYREYYNYIDKNGKVVIPGPFLSAAGFVNGFASVAIDENEEHLQYVIIDNQGKLRDDLRPGGSRYDRWGEYIRFSEYSADLEQQGLMDKEGNVIIQAQYRWIYSPSEPGATLVIGTKDDGSHWIIDPEIGEENKLDLAGINAFYTEISGNNWCIVNYEKDSGNGYNVNGVALFKDGVERRFGSQDDDMSCSYIKGDLFALYYGKSYSNGPSYTEIYNAASDKVIKRMDGYEYSRKLNNSIVILNSIYSRHNQIVILNSDFEPAFTAAALVGDRIKGIRYLADDVYSIDTSFYSGLIKENGQWLIRIYANNMD